MAFNYAEFFKRQQEELAKKQGLADTMRQGINTQTKATIGGGAQPGETIQQPAPSLLSRVFDVISRPAYAMAEGTRRVFDPEGGSGLSDVGAFFKGAGAGISGKEKTSFSDVLGEHGHTGVTKYLGGFALDVALDPSTYLTAGVAKAGKSGAKILTEVGEQSVEKVTKRSSVHIVEEQAKKQAKEYYERLAVMAGKDIDNPVVKAHITREANKAGFESARNQLAKEVADARKIAKESIKPRALEFRFMGKTFASSQSASNAARKATDKILENSQFASKLNSALRTGAKMDSEIHSLMREVMGEGYTNYDEKLQTVLQALKQLEVKTPGQRKAISHAIERGPGTEAWEALGKNEREFAEWVKKEFDEMFEAEKALGLHKDSDKIPNYLYHIYKNEDAAEAAGVAAKKYVGPETPGFSKSRNFSDLESAKAAGLKPVEDIADILAQRYQKHYEVVNRARFVRAMEQNFGVAVKNKKNRALLIQSKAMKDSGSKFISPEVLFDPEVADVIRRVERMSIRDPETRYFLKKFDSIQNQYKFLVTAPNPGFHVRNLIGDTWNNFMDGVVNPMRYKQAAMYLKDRAGETKAATHAMLTGTPNVKAHKFRMKVGSHTLDSGDIQEVLTSRGMKTGFFGADIERSVVPKRGPVGGFEKGARVASEYREDFARTAHFFDAWNKEIKLVEKKLGRKLTKDEAKGLVPIKGADDVNVARNAADRVRKFNFDYQDLTEFEKRKLKRIVPFYTWMRKNIPLQMEMLATKPGRIAVLPKGFRTMEKLLGTSLEDEENPYPGMSQLAPQWLREMAGFRIADEGFSTTFIAPQIPVQDVVKFVEQPAQFLMGKQGFAETVSEQAGTMLENVSPLLAGLPELATGKTFFGNRPIGSLPEYLTSKVPQARVAGQALEGGNAEKILNYLTGIGKYTVNEKAKAGEVRRITDPWEASYGQMREKVAARLGGTPQTVYHDRGPITEGNRSRRYSEFVKGRRMGVQERLNQLFGR